MGATGRRRAVAAAVLALSATAAVHCTPAAPGEAPATPAPHRSSLTPTPSPTPPSPTPPSSLPPAPAEVAAVSAAELGASWAPGCPVDPEQLRRVTVSHLGFDGNTHRGELIVHRDVVEQVIAIFADLYRIGYPIEKMRNVANYPGADDEASMRDNNTSAFNCRRIPGSGNWALHAYGRAIDVNPLLNPYIDDDGVQPGNAGVYLDRDRIDPGVLHDGDPAVRAFIDRGWRWGGHWHSPIDYQHFELP